MAVQFSHIKSVRTFLTNKTIRDRTELAFLFRSQKQVTGKFVVAQKPLSAVLENPLYVRHDCFLKVSTAVS